MANIELIKALRERTGAGIMDCKNALVACGDDVDKACEWLREKGIAKVAKKASRIAAEGLAQVMVDGDNAVVLEVNSETDFVSNSPAFRELVDNVAKLLLANKPACINCAKDLTAQLFTDATVKIGEKIELRRFEILTKKADESFGSYIHMGGKIGVLALYKGTNEETAKGVAMHIAANNPAYIQSADIPADIIAHEKEVQMAAAKNDPKLANKPEAALVKIVEGKVNKYLSESVLFAQEYLLNPELKVEQALKNAGLTIEKFVRFQVGEGIQKREENFAEEVAKIK